MSKNKYLTDEIIKMLNYAYHHEVSNSVFYDYISSYLNVLGLDNMSEYWKNWADEERKHSTWVKTFMQELNIPLSPTAFEEFEYDINKSIGEFVNITMDREDKTTKLYHDILNIAMEFDNSALLVQFANKMLIEQQEETDKALSIQDKVNNIGDNKALMQLFDNTFEVED